MITIPPEERGLAALAHLSGLAGYLIPLGGVVAPIIVWLTNSHSPIIVSLAKQALLLNVMVFLAFLVLLVLFFTVILIPLVWLGWLVLAAIALVLPLVGALKAYQGEYYRYPFVGFPPYESAL